MYATSCTVTSHPVIAVVKIVGPDAFGTVIACEGPSAGPV
jgi:hypothetical protein